MDDRTTDEKIKDLMKDNFDWKPFGHLDGMPFDISKPNQHDSKREFFARTRYNPKHL